MDATNFTYWLQGFFEVSDAKKLDEKQVQIIKDHLGLVFNKITPNRNELPKGSTLQGDSATPFDFDLLPKTYCATTTFDLSGLNKKVC
jgi:hypothetical protein